VESPRRKQGCQGTLDPRMEGEGEGEGGEKLVHSPHCLIRDHNKGLPAKSVTLSTPTEPLSLVSVSSWPTRGTSGGLSVFLLSKSR
jgi:hypothetical protein